MATVSKTYANETAARQAIAPLGAEGATQRHVQMITGGWLGDVREETVGGFAGPVSPDAPVGTFGNVALQRRRGTGTYAGDSDRQRQGSFGDADRVSIVTREHRVEHSRVTGERGLRRFLREADVAGGAAGRVVEELHTGHAVVLASTDPPAPRDPGAGRHELGHAA